MFTVGQLAKRAGVTVRALHHYDAIGLLRPSGRTDGGYRLYSRVDVARLHGIQTLRQLGVPLADMVPLLDGDAGSLQEILARRIGALDEQITQAQALRERLAATQLVLAAGRQPATDDWLAGLSLMSTYERYFSAGELKRAFQRWKPLEPEWRPLVQAIRETMERGTPSGAAEVQPLALRWIDLATRWMDGDVQFLGRWGAMLREQPGLPLRAGMDLRMVEYVDEAIRQRLAVLARYVGPERQEQLTRSRPAWRALAQRGERLMAEGVPPTAAAARELARDWQALRRSTVGDDAALWERLVAAYENEPLLQAGQPFPATLRHYVDQAAALDPDAT